MKWFNQTRRHLLELLTKPVTAIGDRSKPATGQIVNDIDLTKIDSTIRIGQRLGRHRWLLPVLAALALAYLMFVPCDHNSVWIAVRVGAVSFVLDRGYNAPVLKELSVKKLIANPVDVFHTCGSKAGFLASSSLDHQGGTVIVLPATRMRLNTFVLPAGARLSLRLAEQQQGVKMMFEYPMATIAISGTADGPPGEGGCDFQFEAKGTALELTIEPEGPALSDPTYGQIPIKAIEFSQSRIEFNRSLSSIDSGVLSFTEIPDTKYAIERGSRLRMTLYRGTVADLRISHEALSLLLQADASRVRIGYQDERDITPTKLDWLRSKSRNIELWLGLLYLTAVLYGIDVSRFRKAGG